MEMPCAGHLDNSPAEVPANRNINHQICECKHIWIIPCPNWQAVPTLTLPSRGPWHTALQISYSCGITFEILTHKICEHHKAVVLHHYILGWLICPVQSWLCVLELTAQVQLEMLNWASSKYRLSLKIINTGALLGSVLSKKIWRVGLHLSEYWK